MRSYSLFGWMLINNADFEAGIDRLTKDLWTAKQAAEKSQDDLGGAIERLNLSEASKQLVEHLADGLRTDKAKLQAELDAAKSEIAALKLQATQRDQEAQVLKRKVWGVDNLNLPAHIAKEIDWVAMGVPEPSSIKE